MCKVTCKSHSGQFLALDMHAVPSWLRLSEEGHSEEDAVGRQQALLLVHIDIAQQTLPLLQGATRDVPYSGPRDAELLIDPQAATGPIRMPGVPATVLGAHAAGRPHLDVGVSADRGVLQGCKVHHAHPRDFAPDGVSIRRCVGRLESWIPHGLQVTCIHFNVTPPIAGAA